MEKLNIAEILKDCPKGMELDCTIYENVEFDYVEQSPESKYPIHCLMKTNDGYNTMVFTSNGCNDRHPNAKCVIFPKGKTTWEGFQKPFKDGDVVVAEDAILLQMFILKEVISHENDSYDGYCYFGWDSDDNQLFSGGVWGFNRLATEEEKQKLFDNIKANGYKWNAETKTLEKLKKEYPKTYEECLNILSFARPEFTIDVLNEHYERLISSFYKLLICRDAYWKIAGWKPDWGKNSDNYNLIVYKGEIIKDFNCGVNHVLVFPTSEMRDTFYENFKDLINRCKELL